MLFRILSVAILLTSTNVAASQLGKSNQPVNITSDMLYVYPNEDKARFEDNVMAVQEDTKLVSDLMHVKYDGGTKQLQQIEAVDNVELTLPDRVVTGDYGIYNLAAGTVMVTGDVFMKKGTTELRGKTFTYDVNAGKSRLVGNKVAPKPKAKPLEAKPLAPAPTPSAVVVDEKDDEPTGSFLNPLNWIKSLF